MSYVIDFGENDNLPVIFSHLTFENGMIEDTVGILQWNNTLPQHIFVTDDPASTRGKVLSVNVNHFPNSMSGYGYVMAQNTKLERFMRNSFTIEYYEYRIRDPQYGGTSISLGDLNTNYRSEFLMGHYMNEGYLVTLSSAVGYTWPAQFNTCGMERPVTYNTWTHWAFTYDKPAKKIYCFKNGVKVLTTDNVTHPETLAWLDTIMIGAHANLPPNRTDAWSYMLHAYIDEVILSTYAKYKTNFSI